MHARLHACLIDVWEGVRVFLKADNFLEDISTFWTPVQEWGHHSEGADQRRRDFSVTDRSPREQDHQTAFVNEGDGQRRRGLYIRNSKLSVSQTLSQWTYAVAGTDPAYAWDKPLYNHTQWRPPDTVTLATLLSSSLFILLPLDDQVDPLKNNNRHRGLTSTLSWDHFFPVLYFKLIVYREPNRSSKNRYFNPKWSLCPFSLLGCVPESPDEPSPPPPSLCSALCEKLLVQETP